MVKIKSIIQTARQSIRETFKLLWQFKWYIFPYILFYSVLSLFYLTPSPKQYYYWRDKSWYEYNTESYLALTELMLIIFALLFFVGTSNMRNHPRIAKLIFLSSLYFLAVFLDMM
ncbi:MAG: hypothetical protein IJ689_05490 [Alphaproteobacteria bacterium]|nr:hypothetical protein [Alphaproteobacteria bacterium]